MFTTSWPAEYGIPVLVVRGFASQSYAEVVRRRTARHGRATFLWCGAHVPQAAFVCFSSEDLRD
ncbi:hypothetical protein ACFV8T_26450 [Streptomyces sp. NPDC059832]|uniref:hypothetical protein n=1 Tax=Streptomyces sp. NPDC059832 TaxID=3346966 RepID=UPI0036533EC4